MCYKTCNMLQTDIMAPARVWLVYWGRMQNLDGAGMHSVPLRCIDRLSHCMLQHAHQCPTIYIRLFHRAISIMHFEASLSTLCALVTFSYDDHLCTAMVYKKYAEKKRVLRIRGFNPASLLRCNVGMNSSDFHAGSIQYTKITAQQRFQTEMNAECSLASVQYENRYS